LEKKKKHRGEEYFLSRGWKAFAFQQETWRAFAEGASGLLHAPTGQGKTLAVYMGPLVKTLDCAKGLSILWITPLRALAADTLRALREPLAEMAPTLQAEARTGDSSSAVKAKLRKSLPHTLVITPESLSLMMTHGDFREKISGLRCVIVDEWHELLGNKRGVQTELCLARLRRWVPGLQVWGLSATLGNLAEAADVLLGVDCGQRRIVAADIAKPIAIETLIPREMERFPWAGHLGLNLSAAVVREIEKAKTTLLFTNTRSQTELWFQEVLRLRPEWKGKVAMHHGSVDPEERRKAEQGLRDGSLLCVVATSSLDLGVDFSPVDQVIQMGSPKGVARMLQRAGRSGHRPGADSRILGVPTHAVELIEFAAVRDAAAVKRIECRIPLEKPLDVLVQHLVTCAIGEAFVEEEMLAEVRSAHAFRNLTDDEWQWALGFISSGGKALLAYPRYRKARLEDGKYVVDDKRLILQHRMSIGTITSDPAVTLKFASGKALGTVEESFVSRLKPGAVLIFGGRHLKFVRFHQNVATVKLAPKAIKGQVAIWGGSKMPLSSELAHAVAMRLRGAGESCAEMVAVEPILAIQRKWSRVPNDEALVVEHSRSREGEHLFIYPLAGRLVHEGLAALMAYRISQETGVSVQTTQNDYGFSLTAKEGLYVGEVGVREALREEGLLEDLLACMNTAEMARRQFREVARVSGLILQAPPGKPSRSQREVQASSSLLFEVLERYDAENLLLAQARREILERQLELTRLTASLRSLAGRAIYFVETERLTPMAFPLWADRLSALLPAGDAASRLEKMLEELNQSVG
jgi:ATP-dependent helicase Lhr and Lhr-like helicase